MKKRYFVQVTAKITYNDNIELTDDQVKALDEMIDDDRDQDKIERLLDSVGCPMDNILGIDDLMIESVVAVE